METLHVGADGDMPPWCYIDEHGVYTGFDTELVRLACARVGLRPVFHAIEWGKRDQLLADHVIDCVWSGFTVTGREHQYAILGPYARNAIVVLADARLRKLDDLVGKIVVVQSGSSSETSLAKKGPNAALVSSFARLDRFPTVEICRDRLYANMADAFAVDIDVARAFARKSNGRFAVIDDPPLRTEWIGAGFRLKDTALRDRLSRAVESLVADGTCARLSEKFFGDANLFDWKGNTRKEGGR